MRIYSKYFFLLFAALYVLPFTILAKDTTVVGRYELTRDKKTVRFRLEYTIVCKASEGRDTSGLKKPANIFEQFFGAGANTGSALTQKTNMRQALYDLLNSNPGLEIVPQYPEYIIEMIKLVDGKKNKEQAGYLYYSQNTEVILEEKKSNAEKIVNGEEYIYNTFVYTCVLKVKSRTKLSIPSFIFENKNYTYHTNEMVINL